MRVTVTVSLILLSVVFTGQLAVANQTVKIRVSDFPPNYYKDSQGNWVGLSVDLANAIVEAAGLTPCFVDLPWSRTIHCLKEGGVDYCTNLYKTAERSEYLHWVGPVRFDSMVLVVKKGNRNLPVYSLDDVVRVSEKKGHKFCYQDSIFYSEEFSKRIQNDRAFQNSFIKAYDFNKLVSLVSRGLALGFFETDVSMNHYVRNNPDGKDLEIHAFSLGRKPVFHGINKKSIPVETVAQIQHGYEACMSDGTIDRIQRKYIASGMNTPMESERVVSVVCDTWVNYTNKDGTGAYWEIVKAVFEPAGYEVACRTMPWKRAKNEVINKNADALIGEYYSETGNGTDYLYPQWHISIEDPVVALFKKGRIKEWDKRGIYALENNRVAWIRGYDYDTGFLKGIPVMKHEVSEISTGLAHIFRDMVDVFLDYESGIRHEAEGMSFTLNLDRDCEIRIAKPGSRLYVVFANRARSEILIRLFDDRMKMLVETGEIDKIYSKWGQRMNKFQKERYDGNK